ncbi:MAG: hypothetical protein ACRDZZ_01615 [Ilumatobacteraceae bacterium]
MRHVTNRRRRIDAVHPYRSPWRGWAGAVSPAIVDIDLATMLDRRVDVECGLRAPGQWRRRRW